MNLILCQTVPDRARPCQTVPDRARPCQTVPDRTRPCQTVPDPDARPYQTVPDRARPYQTMKKMAVMALFSLLVLIPVTMAVPDVNQLEGEADFRSVKLHWKYTAELGSLSHFTITYCEDQSWGKYRCKKQLLEEREGKQLSPQDANHKEFEVVVNGLRMATNYTLEVTPVLDTDPSDLSHLGQEVTIRTKGCELVSLPEEDNSVDEDLTPFDQSVFEVDPSELFDSSNNLFDSRLSQEIGRALKIASDVGPLGADGDPGDGSRGGSLLRPLALREARQGTEPSRSGFMSPQEEPQALEESSSMEAVVRDYGRGDATSNCVEQPVALVSVKAVGEETEA
ncbi:hypothetical protein Hamer_G020057 [Homarus americanus]|uniref:Fibronectin type-III domain-containing protein n=1 Tax=Homarus americanus TaxID=6706 RepID=A0A8J5JJ07_HOMAM|nr:hypothetical protein Hamer_G020057 [Homarus americanus]